jgi:hypothetical protein
LVALANRILAQAKRLMDDPGYEGEDWELQRLVRTLAMRSITVERMATSGPESLVQEGRGFRGHPEHGQANEDPLATHRAHVDVIAFLTIGDMVLDDLSTVLLKRWKRPVGDIPWRSLMKEVDRRVEAGTVGPEKTAARYIDVLLREARNRVVAHWRHGHTLNLEWQTDDSLRVVLIDPRGLAVALEILRRIDETLPVPSHAESFADLRDSLIAFAPEMDARQREDLASAFHHGGYEVFPPDRIVGNVLELVGLIRTAHAGRA